MFKNINKQRFIYYVSGLIILALGLTLNTKAGLGVSPLISISFSIANIFGLDFSNMTLVLYCLLVFIEMIIHFYLKKDRSYYIMDMLQIVLSLFFTRFMSIFSIFIPNFATDYIGSFYGGIPFRAFVLILAIILTGIGAVLTLDMKLVPNPGDGIVQAIASLIKKEIGFTKNMFDFTCIIITVCLCFVLNSGHIIGINIGTFLAMIGVGRVMAIFNHLFLKYLIKSADLIER